MCLDNGLAPNRWQATIWTSVNMFHWRIYTSLGLNGLHATYGTLIGHSKFTMWGKGACAEWFMYPLSHESISTTIIENQIARHGCGVNQQASFSGEVQHKPLKRFLYHVKLLIAVHANNSSYHHLMVTKLSTTVAHMWVSKGGQDVFGKWLAACSALSHDLKQQCVIFNWTLVIKVHWNFNQIVMEMSLTKWLAFYFSASKC